jgi:hypothetical protein
MCFSPNNRFIYISRDYSILQVDLQETDEAKRVVKIIDYDTLSNDYFWGYNNMTLGPDCKIYVGSNWVTSTDHMTYISNPDAKGQDCNICPACLRIDSDYIVMPNMPNYRLGKLGEPMASCVYPLAVSDVVKKEEVFNIAPNPASSSLQIEFTHYCHAKSIEVFNQMGQVVLQENNLPIFLRHHLDVSGLPTGVYVIKIGEARNQFVKE